VINFSSLYYNSYTIINKLSVYDPLTSKSFIQFFVDLDDPKLINEDETNYIIRKKKKLLIDGETETLKNVKNYLKNNLERTINEKGYLKIVHNFDEIKNLFNK
jgi:hypothetical protein